MKVSLGLINKAKAGQVVVSDDIPKISKEERHFCLKCKYSAFCFILLKYDLALKVDLVKGKLAFAKMSESCN